LTFRPTLFLAALATCSLSAQAASADPRAQIRGDMDAELRRMLERAVGEVDGAPESRFEARRRAQGAQGAAEALLRSEAYYQPVLEDVVEGEDRPSAIVDTQVVYEGQQISGAVVEKIDRDGVRGQQGGIDGPAGRLATGGGRQIGQQIGGIIIPDTADKERPERGEVIAVGPGRELENGNRSSMPVAVGQIVLFKKYSPDEIKVEGEEFLVITLSDVMAIVE